MTLQEIVETLVMVGWRQVEIAERVGLSQAQVSRLYKGQTKSVQYLHADALRSLLDIPPPIAAKRDRRVRLAEHFQRK